jgi:hypothetical protein
MNIQNSDLKAGTKWKKMEIKSSKERKNDLLYFIRGSNTNRLPYYMPRKSIKNPIIQSEQIMNISIKISLF